MIRPNYWLPFNQQGRWYSLKLMGFVIHSINSFNPISNKGQGLFLILL